jgi:hypothetical protein
MSSDGQGKDSRSRSRAPIALNLGSNMSISDAYNRGHDAENRDRLSLDRAAQGPFSEDRKGPQQDSAPAPPLPAQPSNADWKRVKANPVPVYKAKLIPNYENQTKLDPRKEAGIRGLAEAVTHPPAQQQQQQQQQQPGSQHFSQPSNSSDVYRQELQRKSEMYVHSYPQSPLSPTTSPPSNPNQQQQVNSAVPSAFSPQASAPGSLLNQAFTQSPNSYPSTTPLSPTSANANYPYPSQTGTYPPPQATHKNSARLERERGSGEKGSVGVGPVNPNSPYYDDFQTPARRSASAQNILDAKSGVGQGGAGGMVPGGFSTDPSRYSHTSDPSGPSHSYLAHFNSPHSPVSNFTTPPPLPQTSSAGPTPAGSSRERSEDMGAMSGERRRTDREKTPERGLAGSGQGQSKVHDLISRWEQKHTPEELNPNPATPSGLGGPLVDGQDNPPSMTSTPVTRRKFGGREGERDGGERAGSAGGRSHSSRRGGAYDTQGSGGPLANGVGPSPWSGNIGHRSRSQPRSDRDRGDVGRGGGGGGGDYPPHNATTPHRPHLNSETSSQRDSQSSGRDFHRSQNFRPQGFPSQFPSQQQQSPFSPQQQQQPQSPYSPTNTYPPTRSSGRSEISPTREAPDSYSEQIRKASTYNGGSVGEAQGGKPSKPVPLPRQNAPGAMAVVKPTVMHQGQSQQLAFLDI